LNDGQDLTWNFNLRHEGRIVALEPLSGSHADGLFAAGKDEQIWTWLPLNASSPAAMVEFVADCLAAAERGERQHFATRLKATGEIVGSTSYCLIQPENKTVEIGWTWLNPSVWGTGVNVEAKLLMLAHAFDTLGCQRVQIVTESTNERSRAAIEALGAQFEGIHRQDRIVRDNHVRSSAFYSIIDSEWPPVERRLRSRLERGT
jgi:RimJ/RimL family protein N-acetyltransferase